MRLNHTFFGLNLEEMIGYAGEQFDKRISAVERARHETGPA